MSYLNLTNTTFTRCSTPQSDNDEAIVKVTEYSNCDIRDSTFIGNEIGVQI